VIVDTKNPAWPWVARCLITQEHAEIGYGFHAEVLRNVAIHFYTHHDGSLRAEQNTHFSLQPTPPVCDLCYRVLDQAQPLWDHRATPGRVLGDSNGIWIVDEQCHQLILARDEQQLIDHMVRQATDHSGAPEWSVRPVFSAIVRSLFRADVDTGTPTTIEYAP
jgi:hypothetical protein